MKTIIIIAVAGLSLCYLGAQPEYENAVEANKAYKTETTKLIQKYAELIESANPTYLDLAYYYLYPDGLKKKYEGIKKSAEAFSIFGENWRQVRDRQFNTEVILQKKYPAIYSQYMVQKWVPEDKIPEGYSEVDIGGIRKIIIHEYEVRLDGKKGHNWTATMTRQGTKNLFKSSWTGTNFSGTHEEDKLTITQFIPLQLIIIDRPGQGKYSLSYTGNGWRGSGSWYHNEKWYCTAEIHTQQQ